MTRPDSIDPARLLATLRMSHRGQTNAISGADLAASFGFKETKRVREAVQTLRRQHEPICSDASGYWYPIDRDDAAAAIHHLAVMFQPLRESYEGFMAGLDETFGQESLFDTRGEAA